MSDTDCPDPETPGLVWPPAPQVVPPVRSEPARFRTLTPYAWLDLSLGLAAGLIGTFLVIVAVGIVGDLVSRPSGSVLKARFEFCVYAALSAAACFVLVRRAPLFGIMLTTGALIVLLVMSLLVWL